MCIKIIPSYWVFIFWCTLTCRSSLAVHSYLDRIALNDHSKYENEKVHDYNYKNQINDQFIKKLIKIGS